MNLFDDPDGRLHETMVLLVDDQAMIGEAVRRALVGEPRLQFHFCSAGGEAVQAAERIKPTVILQDLIMPGIDGLSLVREYRARPTTRDIPIIVLSTREDPAVKSDAFAAGANDYLVKLPDRIELIARIRYHSRAYQHLLQRGEAFRALRESQQQLTQINLELVRLTNLDGLTGLSNRRYFDEHLALQWAQCTRDRNDISLLMIDVDEFKKYNDTYGHLKGDEALKAIAAAIAEAIERPSDMAARFGGEEFSAVLPGTPAEGATHVAEKIRERIRARGISHSASTVGPLLSVSIGGATLSPRPGEEASTLIQCADDALYEAKRAGRDRVVVRAPAPRPPPARPDAPRTVPAPPPGGDAG
jgi:two-component system, chemotaxis family, response regulator WspR